MSQENVEIARRALEFVRHGEYRGAAGCFRDDVEWHNTSAFPGPRTIVGPRAIIDFSAGIEAIALGGVLAPRAASVALLGTAVLVAAPAPRRVVRTTPLEAETDHHHPATATVRKGAPHSPQTSLSSPLWYSAKQETVTGR